MLGIACRKMVVSHKEHKRCDFTVNYSGVYFLTGESPYLVRSSCKLFIRAARMFFYLFKKYPNCL